MTHVFLLGAGASRDAGIPLATEMTDRFALDLPDCCTMTGVDADAYDHLLALLRMLKPAGSSVDIEEILQAVDLLAEREWLEPFVAQWRDEIRAIDAELLSAGRTFSDLRRQLESVVVSAAWLPRAKANNSRYLQPLVALAVERHAVIATVNYDNTIETAARALGVSIRDASTRDSSDCSAAAIELLKLHGSSDWTLDLTDPPTSPAWGKLRVLTADQMELAPNHRPALRFGQRQKLTSVGPFLGELVHYRDHLAQTDTLGVIGYSFRDEHIDTLTWAWLKERERATLFILDPLADALRKRVVALSGVSSSRVVPIALPTAKGLPTLVQDISS